MTDFVLVHGTTQDASGWQPLADELTLRGHRSWAVDLNAGDHGLSARCFAESARKQVPETISSPVVVAHSGSGLVLPAIAEALGAVHQVWIAALVPDPTGERSFTEELMSDSLAMFNPEWRGIDPTTDRVLATYFLFHDCDLTSLRWALGTLRLFTAIRGVYSEVPQARSTQRLPSTYLAPQADRTLRPEFMHQLACNRLGVEAVEIPGGHCPHAARPDEVATLLDQCRTDGRP